MLVNHGLALNFVFLCKRDDLPPFTFRGATLPGASHRRLRLLDLSEPLTIDYTFWCFLVQSRRKGSRTSASGEFQDSNGFTEIELLYRQRITDRYFFAGFDFFAIDQHLACFHGVARQGAGFEKPGRP